MGTTRVATSAEIISGEDARREGIRTFLTVQVNGIFNPERIEMNGALNLAPHQLLISFTPSSGELIPMDPTREEADYSGGLALTEDWALSHLLKRAGRKSVGILRENIEYGR